MKLPVLVVLSLLLVSVAADDLKVVGPIRRTPESGRVTLEDDVEFLECSFSSDLPDDQVAEDFQWLLLDANGEEEYNILTEGFKIEISKVSEDDPTNVRCRSGSFFADFEVGNSTKMHTSRFRVKKFKPSYAIVEKEDLKVPCEVLNRTELPHGVTIAMFKQEVSVRWYMWSIEEDLSFQDKNVEGQARKINCSDESMKDSHWQLIPYEADTDEQEPHIKLLKKNDLEYSEIKIEDAQYSDRRGYKCVIYNVSNPEECSESVFFVRVKNKYAALWPFLGIVVEVVVLCVIIFICEKRKATKECPEDEEEYNSNGVGQGAPADNNSSLRRRT